MEYFNLDESIRGIDTYKEWAKGIDEFVMNEIEYSSLENSLKTYDHIINGILESIGLNPDTNGAVKMEKLFNWISKVLIPERDLSRRKQEIING